MDGGGEGDAGGEGRGWGGGGSEGGTVSGDRERGVYWGIEPSCSTGK